MTTEAPPLEHRPRQPPKYGAIVKAIDLFVLAGSRLDPDEHLARASRIWSQCGITFRRSHLRSYDEAETRRLITTTPEGTRTPLEELTVVVNPDEPTWAMRNLRDEWSKQRRGHFAVFFCPKVQLTLTGAPSAADPNYGIVYLGVPEARPGVDLAHELGHHLLGIDLPHYIFRSPLMRPRQLEDEIVDLECRAARGDHRARFELIQRTR